MRRSIHVALVAALLSPIGAATATSDAIQVSSDGFRFGPRLSQPLFAGDLRWVPGDVREATFFVRNTTGSAATVSLTGPDVNGSDQQLVDDLNVSILDPQNAREVESGAAVPVTVRVAYRPESANPSQDGIGDLVLQVTLTDLTGVSAGTGSIDAAGPTSAELPDAGSRLLGALLIAALGCIAAGTALTFLRRPPPTEGSAHV